MPDNNRVQTGIAGLDRIFLGGVRRGNLNLVAGSPGSGKSLLGLEFIYRGITAFDEPGIVVVFESDPEMLHRDAAAFGWDLHELEQEGKLKIVLTSPQVLDEELRSPDSVLLKTAADMGAKRIFIDSIAFLRPAANGIINGHGSYRDMLKQLIEGLRREKLTAVLAHESGRYSDTAHHRRGGAGGVPAGPGRNPRPPAPADLHHPPLVRRGRAAGRPYRRRPVRGVGHAHHRQLRRRQVNPRLPGVRGGSAEGRQEVPAGVGR